MSTPPKDFSQDHPNFSIKFTNLRTSSPHAGKAMLALRMMAENPMIQIFMQDNPCEITIEKTSDSYHHLARIKVEEDRVRIGLMDSFLGFDVGRITGMLLHEYGAHVVPTAMPGVTEQDEAFRGARVPVPGSEGKRIMDPAEAHQSDHVMSAIFGSIRNTVYKEVVLQQAEISTRRFAPELESAGGKENFVKSLIDCYLTDMAHISVTNDHRPRILPGSPGSQEIRADVAKAYNSYRESLLNDAPSAIKHFFPAQKTESQVLGDIMSMGLNVVAGSILPSSNIERGNDIMSSLSRIFSWGGSGSEPSGPQYQGGRQNQDRHNQDPKHEQRGGGMSP